LEYNILGNRAEENMNTPAASIAQIKESIEGVVGKAKILTDADTLKRYSCDTSLSPCHLPDMVVKARTRDEVQGVLKIANANNYPVVPRSSGTGTYGTGIPEEGGLVLDLSGMKRIPRTDTRNRWVLIEPGATFGELEEELAKHGMQPLNPLLPRKDKSVITSVLEREPVLTCKTECDEPLRTMELVWGTGELLRTGSMCVDTIPAEEIPDKTNSDLCSVGGPGIDWWRLLTGCQGTFGVVTIMNVKIFHKPLKQKVLFITFDSLEDAVTPFYAIQRREIGHECFLLNGYDIAAIMAQNQGDIPGLAKKIPRYAIVLNLWGGQFFPEDRIAFEEKAVGEIAERYNLACPRPTCASRKCSTGPGRARCTGRSASRAGVWKWYLNPAWIKCPRTGSSSRPWPGSTALTPPISASTSSPASAPASATSSSTFPAIPMTRLKWHRPRDFSGRHSKD
jgi:hypothetical protein